MHRLKLNTGVPVFEAAAVQSRSLAYAFFLASRDCLLLCSILFYSSMLGPW